MYEPHDPELFPLEGKLLALERTPLGLGGDSPHKYEGAIADFEKSLVEGLQHYGLAWVLLGQESRTPDFLVRYDFAWKVSSLEVVARARILAGNQEIKQVSSRASGAEFEYYALIEAAESLSSRIHEALLEYVQKGQVGNARLPETTQAPPAPPPLAEKPLTALNWRSILLILLALIALVWNFRDFWRPHLEALLPSKISSQALHKLPTDKNLEPVRK
jgi:hypothetical protein